MMKPVFLMLYKIQGLLLFARTLNKVAMTHLVAVTACNFDLATLAITTFLKTGAESSVDRLMKQMATFVSEVSDEFCTKFLSGNLRDYKTSIADTIITVIKDNSVPTHPIRTTQYQPIPLHSVHLQQRPFRERDGLLCGGVRAGEVRNAM